jgi:2-polyprenyl-6-methoxyphenol hydroxylase-like FAD-dependent oxidoreductase
MDRKRILISGGGIAGLTLAIELKRRGFTPLVIEREPALRAEGYMMDFFGTGWDVAARMGLTDRLRQIRYPIDAVEFVDGAGKPYTGFPIERVRRALGGGYVYLRRGDLERILSERAREAGIEIRYGASLAALDDRGDTVTVRFAGGSEDAFALVVGADGVHSRVRALAFGDEAQFARFLRLYVAAFHVPSDGFSIGRKVKLYEEADHFAFLYPLSQTQLDATFVFRRAEMDIPHRDRIGALREQLRNGGWIIKDILNAYTGEAPVFFDSATQIAMPQWHKGRVALIGDACGCLTLLAGQGSHMAMAGAYVLAQELARHEDYAQAFAAYQAFMRPAIDKRQKSARQFVGLFVPSKSSREWLRRLVIRLFFSPPFLSVVMRFFGSNSILAGRAD